MKAIVNTGPGQLALQDRPLPQPGSGQVRICTEACGICATDLKMIAGWERTGFPAVPGHEWAGTVDAVGAGVDPGLVGRRCVAENVLADGGEVGFEHPGGYAAYLLTEARGVHVLAAGFDLGVATLIEPLAVAIRAVRRLRLQGPNALVFGDGPLGLLVLMLLCRAGVVEVVLVGGRSGRLALAGELGATQTLDYHRLGVDLRAIHQACGERRFSSVVEASGSHAALRAGMELAAAQGRVLVVGDYGGARADFEWDHLLHQEIELIGSCGGGGAWTEAVRLAQVGHACSVTPVAVQGELPLARLITHRLPATQFAEGMALASSHRGDVIKVVLEW